MVTVGYLLISYSRADLVNSNAVIATLQDSRYKLFRNDIVRAMNVTIVKETKALTFEANHFPVLITVMPPDPSHPDFSQREWSR